MCTVHGHKVKKTRLLKKKNKAKNANAKRGRAKQTHTKLGLISCFHSILTNTPMTLNNQTLLKRGKGQSQIYIYIYIKLKPKLREILIIF